MPPNALCLAAVPQLDLLRVGKPALFVTNGGQNSLMESMTVGTPVLVCPGFGDQLTNAAKVEAQGWGAKVSRPPPSPPPSSPAPAEKETPAADVSAYQAAVRSGVRKVLDEEGFAKQERLFTTPVTQIITPRPRFFIHTTIC